ncbi:MAG: sigma-70 family RNA polymerase sigma factor [Phycisphaerales bacterium]|nr:sigma-70 family RNA polymerase sigma factor [Phycisphaerales bacterium]
MNALAEARPALFPPHPWHHDPIVILAPDPGVLIQRVQQGDQAAFADLYDTLAPVVFGAVKRVVRDPAMSEEVTQEVFVELWRTAARFDSARASVSTWAVTIARRRAVDRVRKEQSQRNRIDDLGRQPHDVGVEPGDSVVASLDAERITRALDGLPDDQRVVIELAFLEGHAHGTIAEMLDLPLGTVKGRVRGGLKRLRSLIGDDG